MGVLDKFLDAIKLNDDYDDDGFLDDDLLDEEEDDDFLDDDFDEKPKKKFFDKFSNSGLNFAKLSLFSTSCNIFDRVTRFVDTLPSSLNIAEFLRMFSIVVVDLVPSLIFWKSSFITSLAFAFTFGSCFIMFSRV